MRVWQLFGIIDEYCYIIQNDAKIHNQILHHLIDHNLVSQSDKIETLLRSKPDLCRHLTQFSDYHVMTFFNLVANVHDYVLSLSSNDVYSRRHMVVSWLFGFVAGSAWMYYRFKNYLCIYNS